MGLVAFAVWLAASASLPAASRQDAQALTNADVIRLVQAGLGDEVVLAAIAQAARTAFDTSADGLVALKKAGVSDAVITAMLGGGPAPAAASRPAAPPPTTAPSRATPGHHPPGIYIDVGTGGTPSLVPLEPTVFSQGRSGGAWTSAMTFGLARQQWRAVVRGPRAGIRTTIQQPTFYFYFDQPSSGPGQAGGFAGWLAGATSPNEFVLVQMYARPNQRELVVGEFNAFGSTTGTRSADTVPYDIERLAPGVYRVSPTEVLGPGEFCFFYSAGAATLGAGVVGRLFDFGVDPPQR